MPDIDNEIRRFAYKVEAGAEYAITQPVFDLRLLETFLKRIEGFRIPVIAGIWPLTSLRNAEFMKNDLRVSVPDEIMLRMPQADTPELARAEGIRIAQEMLAAVRRMVQGVQVSAPFGRYALAAEVIAERAAARRRQRSACDDARLKERQLATFEESLKKLETIVDQLERGDLPLEDSLQLFEEGVSLSAECKKQLEEAEGKVQMLVKQRDGSMEREPFAPLSPPK